ncbi:hypothetical protein AOQ84DRAFT_224189, partial [Glonium stellatum]
MSGFGGFGGGFGSNNQQQQQQQQPQGTGFGFGSSNTNTGAFGSSNTNTGFGAKPFGATTTTSGSGLFGSATSTAGSTGFGGFGTTANNTSAGFGSSNTGGGLFGSQSKPTFGASTTGTAGLFGSGTGTGTGTGFGSNTTTTGFGSSTPAFGANNQPPPNNGTASTPFQPFTEKDANASSHYQTIAFQQPYTNYSLEELRLADYNQGRRYGNQNGQAGAFGQSTGFGGFGSTNANTNTNAGFGSNTNTTTTGGGLFGSSNTNTGFGATNAGTGFGSASTTSTGLFGQKPATSGLFGTPTTSSQPSGGLFGGTAGTTGFGSGTTGFGASNTGGSLFGQQNQTQNKPAFGGFGSTGTTGGFGSTGTTGFGQQTNTSTGGGLFGNNATSTASTFGNNQQSAQSNPFGGSFGQNQQAQNQPQSGGLFGGFGTNNQQQQQKPSLFGSAGSANTGSSLFGQQNNQPPQSTGLFGNTNTQQQGGGLFGQKPATTGTSLFGSSAQNTNTGGGLFGNLNANQNQQPNQGSGLFGQQNQQQQQKPLFGGPTTANTGTGGGLFGSMGQNNANNATLGSSLFGASLQQQQPQQQQMNNSLFAPTQSTASLITSLNHNPYGNDALFANLGTPNPSPGPLATPLSSSQKVKKNAILPQHKINPAASSRLITPQKRPGYGFSYSTYGTPGSAVSNASPGGFSSSLLGGGSLGRSLGKSFSTSNLRQGWTPEDSILAPGAFSNNGRNFAASGSLKRLNVNRSITARTPLFGNDVEAASPTTTRKSVSFDPSITGGTETNGITNGTAANGSTSTALVRTETEESSPQPEERTSRSSSRSSSNSAKANGAPSRPEMEQVTGKELAVVPEDGSPPGPSTAAQSAAAAREKARLTQTDQVPGEYWMRPSLEELRKMTPQQLKKVSGFIVGREGVGKIEFQPDVDLSNIPLDRIMDGIVSLTVRSATAYGSDTPVPKPPRGKGLNVPSIITLENSWPRSRAGRLPVHEKRGFRFDKHVERLKRVTDTEFIAYEPSTGTWKFAVQHYTTYGLDYEGQEDVDEYLMEESALSAAPDTPTQVRTPGTRTSQISAVTQDDDTMLSPTQSSPDDTFDFKKGKRAHLPGGFGDEPVYDEDEADDSINNTTQSFLEERSVGSLNDDHAEDVDMSEESESELVEERDMAGSFSVPVQTAERSPVKETNPFSQSVKPKSILKASQPLRSIMETPGKGNLVFEEDWADQLQRTVSPKKQDRQALRETQGTVLKERDENIPKMSQSINNGKAFATSIDLMNSLFGHEAGRKSATQSKKGAVKGFELPYAKRPKTVDDLEDMDPKDRSFHQSNKPRWSADGTLIYATSGNTPSMDDGILRSLKGSIVSEHKDIRFAKLVTPVDATPDTLVPQKEHTKIQLQDGVPTATVEADFDFEEFTKHVAIDSPEGVHEQQVWELASILFDDFYNFPSDVPREHYEEHKERYRKDKLSEFWESLVFDDAERQVQKTKSPEDRAVAYLSAHNIVDACQTLLGSRNLRLATMVSQIGGDVAMRQDMAAQIDEWRRLDVLSEMDDSIRAIYELLAGNCGKCEGKLGDGRENKAADFQLASRFGLDWRRAFGLRLWYGTLADEPIHMAVAQFADDLREGRELVKPVPWFVEHNIDRGWVDPAPETREDLLWGLLKLYAAQRLHLPANVEDVLAPQNTSGNPLNARLSFQLIHLLRARSADPDDDRRVHLPTARSPAAGLSSSFLSASATSNTDASASADADAQAADPLAALADALTLTYATTLHTARHWPTALFAYAHLSAPAARIHHSRRLLAFFAPAFDAVSADPLFAALTTALCVPVAWLHAAKALLARARGERARECVHLIEAGEAVEAHVVLCRAVAPRAVVARELDALRELLGGFEGGGGGGGGGEGDVSAAAAAGAADGGDGDAGSVAGSVVSGA